MAFRYLNIANIVRGSNSEKKYIVNDLIEDTFNRLKPYFDKKDVDGKLNKEDVGECYVIITVFLLEKLPKLDRRDAVWTLAEKLPRHFFPLIEDITYNCS